MKKFALQLAALLILPALALGAPGEPKEYVINKGDTMWGISERFFGDPNFWPDLWAKNPAVPNPHLIYPGQKLQIYKDRIEVVPPVQVAQPSSPAIQAPPAETPIEEKVFRISGNEGFVTETVPNGAGTIVGTYEDRVMVGAGDVVYTDLGTASGARGGDVYSVYRKGDAVKHPDKNTIVGYRFIPVGTVTLQELTPTGSKAFISSSNNEMGKGDILLPYTERRKVIPLRKASGEIEAKIIATFLGTALIGTGDIVYLDRGRSDGLAVGNLLYGVREISIERTGPKKIEVPRQVMGAMVVIDAGEKTATALVVKTAEAMSPGTRVTTGSN